MFFENVESFVFLQLLVAREINRCKSEKSTRLFRCIEAGGTTSTPTSD